MTWRSFCAGQPHLHFIEMGVHAINSLQVTARNMDPARLKREFGDGLTFWGGVDRQHVLWALPPRRAEIPPRTPS